MRTHQKKEDVSKLLPREFYLFGIEGDFGGDSMLA